MKSSLVCHSKVRLRTLLRRFGLPPTCTDKEVSDVYREIAKQVHPDINKNADAQMFTLLQKDYDELKDLLKAYPMSARRAGDFVSGFGGVAGDHQYSGKKPSNPSEAQAQWAEQAMWEQKHRDRLRNFHPHEDRGHHVPPHVPFQHKIAVVGIAVTILYYGFSWILVFSSGRKCKQKPNMEELNKAVAAKEATKEISTMSQAEASKRKIASVDPEYYARRFRKDTDHYESDKIKRWKDKEARRKTGGVNSRRTPTQVEGNSRGAYDMSMKDFKRFMEERVGSRDSSGDRTRYNAGLGKKSTRGYQDSFRQQKPDPATPVAMPMNITGGDDRGDVVFEPSRTAQECFAKGEKVEYWSGSFNAWIPGQVLDVLDDGERYRLDVKERAHAQNMRRTPANTTNASTWQRTDSATTPPLQEPPKFPWTDAPPGKSDPPVAERG